MHRFNLDRKTFLSVRNTGTGEAGKDTRFYYYQEGELIWGEYGGGHIIKGFLIGKTTGENSISFTYQHINTERQSRIGFCESIITTLPHGKLHLDEHWRWLDGAQESGESAIEEV